MTRLERLNLVENTTGKKVVSVEVEKNNMIYWAEDGVIAKYNMKTGKLTFTR